MAQSVRMTAMVILLVTLSRPARAAVQLSPGQELIYTGTAVWTQSVSGGPPEIFRGPVRIVVLVTHASPTEGYSVDLMAAVTREGTSAGQRPLEYADLNTVQYRPDLSRVTAWPRARARDPLGDLIQVLDVPLAPRAALNPGDWWLDTSVWQPVLHSSGFPALFRVGEQMMVAGRSCRIITRELGTHLPPDVQQKTNLKSLSPVRREFGGGSFEELEQYTDRIAVDLATMQVVRQDLHARQRRLFGKQSIVVDLSATVSLAPARQLPASELARRVDQAAALVPIEHRELPAPPGDAAAARKKTRQELAAFRRQFPGSPYLPVARQIDASLDQPGRGSNMQALLEGLVGRPAPNFKLKGLDGREQTLGAYRGRLVLLNFFGNT